MYYGISDDNVCFVQKLPQCGLLLENSVKRSYLGYVPLYMRLVMYIHTSYIAERTLSELIHSKTVSSLNTHQSYFTVYFQFF